MSEILMWVVVITLLVSNICLWKRVKVIESFAEVVCGATGKVLDIMIKFVKKKTEKEEEEKND